MADRQYIKLTVEDRVATITIDRPPVNALNRDTFHELDEALTEIAQNPDARALVITGSGPAFAAGADIREFTELDTAEQAQQAIERLIAVVNRVDELPIPAIAAVNGYCLGGGQELALACDLRIASANARFGQPEVDLGIMPGWGGTQRLLR